MGEHSSGIDDALLAAVEQTKAKLRRAAARAGRAGDDVAHAHSGRGHERHGDRGGGATGAASHGNGGDDERS